jgi:hypothetical protein
MQLLGTSSINATNPNLPRVLSRLKNINELNKEQQLNDCVRKLRAVRASCEGQNPGYRCCFRHRRGFETVSRNGTPKLCYNDRSEEKSERERFIFPKGRVWIALRAIPGR